jgi:hypothetical protein
MHLSVKTRYKIVIRTLCSSTYVPSICNKKNKFRMYLSTDIDSPDEVGKMDKVCSTEGTMTPRLLQRFLGLALRSVQTRADTVSEVDK